jgi:hypothetical protein
MEAALSCRDRLAADATCAMPLPFHTCLCPPQVLFQQVPVLAFKFCALSYDLR